MLFQQLIKFLIVLKISNFIYKDFIIPIYHNKILFDKNFLPLFLNATYSAYLNKYSNNVLKKRKQFMISKYFKNNQIMIQKGRRNKNEVNNRFDIFCNRSD